MARYENNTFVGQRIQIDGHEFIANRFNNCVLVYGGGPLVLNGNIFDNVQWQFIDAAARTVYLLSSFYQQGGEAKRFIELMLATFGKPALQPMRENSTAPPMPINPAAPSEKKGE